MMVDGSNRVSGSGEGEEMMMGEKSGCERRRMRVGPLGRSSNLSRGLRASLPRIGQSSLSTNFPSSETSLRRYSPNPVVRVHVAEHPCSRRVDDIRGQPTNGSLYQPSLSKVIYVAVWWPYQDDSTATQNSRPRATTGAPGALRTNKSESEELTK
uniref:Uncharacterized protein n=1 Tax=Vespula pensylvanica TaxID=30213 RepID=A0A834PAQ4_VESPE|nr:hypothetical protein H0235_002714 [Vespula pensylvanica]